MHLLRKVPAESSAGFLGSASLLSIPKRRRTLSLEAPKPSPEPLESYYPTMALQPHTILNHNPKPQAPKPQPYTREQYCLNPSVSPAAGRAPFGTL